MWTRTEKPSNGELVQVLDGKMNGNRTEYELVSDPPDGGYGWIILLAVTVQTFISHR